jgi:secreted trypsin-like serine protease
MMGDSIMSPAFISQARRLLFRPDKLASIPLLLMLTLPVCAQTAGLTDDPTIDDIVAAHRSEYARIIGGIDASPGKWPSMAAIFLRRPGERPFNFCGGTIIGRQWVLTAAHCAAAMRKMGPSVSFFVREGTQDLASSQKRDIDVIDIVSNDSYTPHSTLNDVALLQLKNPASAPRQKLVSQIVSGALVVDQRMSTVIGFGLMTEGGSASARLKQVDVPIIGQPACRQVYGADKITAANFCAGEKGKDSCQGDSGGPLFVVNETGEQLQAGIVSWGRGCGREGFYGVYASVGNFEQWIKLRVPDAQFAQASNASTSPSRPTEAASVLTDGATTVAKPSEIAQVHIDIVEGNKFKVKSFIQVRVSSSVSGSLVIFNENPDGSAYQLYPSKAFPGPDGRSDTARIEAGKELRIPSSAQYGKGYRFEIQPPLGTNKLRAIVVPQNRKIDEIIAVHSDGEVMRDLALVISLIVDAVDRGAVGVQITDRGSAEVSYEIVN